MTNLNSAESGIATINRELALVARIEITKPLFVMLCFYLISQAFMIPILRLGPSWTLWPRLSDFAWVGLAVSYLYYLFRKSSRLGTVNVVNKVQKDTGILLGLMLLTAVFFAAFTVFIHPEPRALNWAAHGLVRATQFITLYFFCRVIVLTSTRIVVIRRCLTFSLIFVCISVFLTYFHLIPYTWFVYFIPTHKSLAGPWAKYADFNTKYHINAGYGSISYNHAYTAVQILLLLALREKFTNFKRSGFTPILMLLTMVSAFLTGSRAGFAATAFFLLLQFVRKPTTALIVTLFLWGGSLILDEAMLESTVQRHGALMEASDEDSLNGRPYIWRAFFNYLNEGSFRWFIGTGLGGAVLILEETNAAHMLPLHVVTETGLIGLSLFLVTGSYILITLWKYESGSKPFFWCSIALLFSSFTQETFYPVPALGHFPGFYLVALALISSDYMNNRQYTG
jgi:hypothetical protein